MKFVSLATTVTSALGLVGIATAAASSPLGGPCASKSKYAQHVLDVQTFDYTPCSPIITSAETSLVITMAMISRSTAHQQT